MENNFRARGRGGFRGGVRGGGRGGHAHFPANQEPDDGSTFTLHPRTKFAGLGITQVDVSVKEIGFYSLYGDLNQHEQLEVCGERSLMRSMVLQCDSRKTVAVGFDLDEGYNEEAVERVLFKHQIPVLMKWAEKHGNDPNVIAIREKIEIVSTCAVLADLMKEIYDTNSSEIGVKLVFGAAKVNGKILVGHIIRPGVRGITEGEPSGVDGFPRGGSDHSKYWGRRFEGYMTEGKVVESDSDNKNVAAPRFRTVLHTKLRDLNLLLAAGVDAVDPWSQADYPKKYVDFVTCTSRSFERGKERSLYGRNMLRWWTNNALGGTGNIHAGIHTDGHVTEIKTFRIDEIPALVQEKEREIGKNFWAANVCLGFIYSLLKFVTRQVVKSHDRVVYEFTCLKEDGRFSCREIPVELAEGHDYLLGNTDDFLC